MLVDSQHFSYTVRVSFKRDNIHFLFKFDLRFTWLYKRRWWKDL